MRGNMMTKRLLGLLATLTAGWTLNAGAEPHWIWLNKSALNDSPNGEKVDFRVTFTLPGELSKATLLLTCDNGGEAYINGKLALSNSDWNSPTREDVKKFLKAGENELRFEGRNQGGPAGFIGKLEIKPKNGAAIKIE
ncbi:MAG: hypothetical protein AAF514_18835, partial [Verrucomicrobiota bacterium]